MSDNEGEQGSKSTFSTYMAEGDQLFHKGQYSKAVQSYSTALLLQPGDRNCLVARSRCYVIMGEAENALKDAEASLKDDKNFFKGLYQKAEALYSMGYFEFALVFYHRGHKLRPELQVFRLGIQKAEEAVTNSVGSPSSVKLENQGDLSSFHKVDERKKARPKSFIHPLKKDLSAQRQKTLKRERTAKQLLGELYTDKEYLEKLLKDEDLIKGKTRTGERLQDVIMSCISYLDARTEFWQQQKPMYAHERDRKVGEQQRNRTRNRPPSHPSFYIHKTLEEIDTAWYDLMDLGNMDKALENHLKDLELAQQGWEEKSPLAQDELEKAWLLHEISRCYLELKSRTKARDYGIQSLSAANDIGDEKWQLNASVLVTQAELKLGNYKSSVLPFEKALDQARLLQDDDARAAIQKALQETRQQVSQ